MKRFISFLFYPGAISILLIAASPLFLGESRCFSQGSSIKSGEVSSSPLSERATLSSSEVVTRYWKASADGKFSETRRYIDFCNLNAKYSIDREILKTLTQLAPRSIYEGIEAPDIKLRELIIGRITEAAIGQAVNEILIGAYTYSPTPVMRSVLRAYYISEYQLKIQELSEKYGSPKGSETLSSAAGGNIRRQALEYLVMSVLNLRGQFVAKFAHSDITGRGLGDFIAVKGADNRSRERLSVDYAVKILDRVSLSAQVHAAATFLVIRPENGSPSQQRELVIGSIEEESLKDAAASIVAIIHFQNYPVARSRFELKRCKGEWKIVDVNLFYKDVLDLRKDLKEKENERDNRKISFLFLNPRLLNNMWDKE